jgi:hypothetical protein
MFRRKQGPLVVEDAWQVHETVHDGHRLVIRGNAGAKPLVASKDYGIKVGLAVPFNEPQHDGMPTSSEMAQLEVVEEAIVSGLAGHAVLVAVLTTNGMREFVAYTGNGGWLPSFDERLQSSITTH